MQATNILTAINASAARGNSEPVEINASNIVDAVREISHHCHKCRESKVFPGYVEGESLAGMDFELRVKLAIPALS